MTTGVPDPQWSPCGSGSCNLPYEVLKHTTGLNKVQQNRFGQFRISIKNGYLFCQFNAVQISARIVNTDLDLEEETQLRIPIRIRNSAASTLVLNPNPRFILWHFSGSMFANIWATATARLIETVFLHIIICYLLSKIAQCILSALKHLSSTVLFSYLFLPFSVPIFL
jgi:hypothetical protein